MNIRVMWHDGHVTEAGSWTWLLRKLMTDPWNRPHKTPDDMRNALAFRAYVWSGEIVDPRLPPAQFWSELAETGLLELEVCDECRVAA